MQSVIITFENVLIVYGASMDVTCCSVFIQGISAVGYSPPSI